ncbi:LPS-assembly protein LptD [Candidatus Spongiihabitans sp.]|uniref:LPS-assembly protein LptD n=1 Tax=Candidatus Spongiihabitans sp. TaxID=3101308 RepID=UPI003C705B83
MRPNKFKNHILASIAAVMTTVPALDVYAQSSISADIPADISTVGFAGIDICKPGRIDVPLALKEAPAGDQSELPIRMEADQLEAESPGLIKNGRSKNGLIKLSGKAQVVQGNRGVYADEITYDQDTDQATASGNIKFYTSRGDEVLADSLDLEVPAFTGSAQNARIKFAHGFDGSPHHTERQHEDYVEDYSMLAPFRNKVSQTEAPEEIMDDNTYVRARATADTIEFEGADYERLHNATFSSCEPGNDDVLLIAREIELDHAAGIGTAKSMKVKFKNVPIFYFPRVSFPINNQRKTGFLFPSIGHERESGAILEVPYYLNIAPNHDATVIPRILSKRGVQLYGEYRYLTQKSEGSVQAEVLPSDDVFNDDRYAWRYDHKQDFNDRWNVDVDLQTVSDNNYLKDFTSDVGVTSSSYVPRRASLFYRGPNLFFKASASAYEPANSDIVARPYDRLPRLNLDLKQQDLGRFKYGMSSEFTYFEHDDSKPGSATRLRINPYVSLPIDRIYGYVTPKLSLQTISYSLNNSATGEDFPDDSPSVTVPIASVDSGLFFGRVFQQNDSVFLQTLEPRLLYLNIPEKREQEDFLNFDSGSGSNSSFGHFFRGNRFFGGDRVGDTHQITLGLTSRIINQDDGRQRLNISVGQIFFLEDRKVGLPDKTLDETIPETGHRSDFFTEATASVTEDWNIRGFARVGSESNDLEFARISTQYYRSSRRNASIGYSRTKHSSEQASLKFETPVGRRWQINAKARYSIRESETRSSEIGLTYDGCCWAIRLLAQHYLDGSGNFKNRFIITFELDDLGRIRSGL